MQIIMESWRKWLKKVSDHPADGLTPADEEVYDVHRGGLEMPKLSAPSEHPENAPIKNRPALQIDPEQIDYAPGEFDFDLARSDLDANRQNLRKSDRLTDKDRNPENALKIATDNVKKIDRELTHLESSDTITPLEAEKMRERLSGFKEILAHVDTVDVDLFHLQKELSNFNATLRSLTTKREEA